MQKAHAGFPEILADESFAVVHRSDRMLEHRATVIMSNPVCGSAV